MATSPNPNPQASAPQPGAGGPASDGNSLQTALGKIAQLLHQIATQNTSVQEPLNKAVMSIVEAIQMGAQSQPQPQQAQAPPQQ